MIKFLLSNVYVWNRYNIGKYKMNNTYRQSPFINRKQLTMSMAIFNSYVMWNYQRVHDVTKSLLDNVYRGLGITKEVWKRI